MLREVMLIINKMGWKHNIVMCFSDVKQSVSGIFIMPYFYFEP